MDSVDNYSSSAQVSKELKISQSHLLEIADVSKTILPLPVTQKNGTYYCTTFYSNNFWLVYLLY